MQVYNNDSSSPSPGDPGEQTVIPGEVPVIYVGEERPQPRVCPQRPHHGRGSLRDAARALHRAADYVDDLRRSLERARDRA